MAKSYDERIAETKLKIEQEQNRVKQLIQKQKKEERNARTKRLCSRMGLFESMLPDTIPLTDEQFKIFLEKTIATEHSRHRRGQGRKGALIYHMNVVCAVLQTAFCAYRHKKRTLAFAKSMTKQNNPSRF